MARWTTMLHRLLALACILCISVVHALQMEMPGLRSAQAQRTRTSGESAVPPSRSHASGSVSCSSSAAAAHAIGDCLLDAHLSLLLCCPSRRLCFPVVVRLVPVRSPLPFLLSLCAALLHVSYYSTHPSDTNFADPPLAGFSTLIPLYEPRLHAPAAYGPQSGFGEGASEPAQGQAIPLMHEIFEGLSDDYLCGPLPPVLRANQSLWRIPDLAHKLDLQRDFDASGLLSEDLTATPRWPRLPLDLTVAGSILFASRGGGSGGCTFAEKSYWAGKAGAAGLVVYGSLGRSADVLYTMGLLPAEFQAFLERQGESAANYTFPLPSVYVTATTFLNLCLLPFLDGMAKQSIWYRMGQKYLYPNGNPASSTAGSISSSGGNGGGLTGASSSGSDWASSGSVNGSDSSSSGGSSSNVTSSSGDASSGAETSSSGAVDASTGAARRLLSTSGSDSDSPSLSDLLAQAQRPPRQFAPWFPQRPSKVLADPSTYEHTYELVADFAYLPLWAILDPASATAPGGVRIIEQVEYGGFRIAAYFLLVVPGIWILVAVIYAVRRCCQNKRAEQLRLLRENAVPVVTFKTVRAGSAAMIAAGAKQSSKKTKADSKPPQQHQQHHSMEGKEAEEAEQDQHLRYVHIDLDDPSAPAAHSQAASQQTSEVAIHLSPAAAIALEEDEDSPPQSPSARLAASSQSRTVNNTTSSLNEHELAAPAVPSHAVAASGAAASPAPPSDQEVVGVGVTSRGQHIKLTGSTCAICLLDFTDGDRLKVLPCSHGFHPEGCINPWLEKSDECPVCRASISDALEVEPPCCAWCCDPPRSAAQRFVEEQQQRDVVRQRQARREQAEEADRLRELREREMEMMPLPAVHPAPHHDLEGQQQQQGATIVDLHSGSASAASSSSGAGGLSAEESEVLAARFHVESLARCIADLFAVVRRGGLTPPAELVMLSDQMLLYASAARSGRMDDRAVAWLRRMLGLMPAIHSKLASARSEEAMDAAAVADSMMQFACDEIARTRV